MQRLNLTLEELREQAAGCSRDLGLKAAGLAALFSLFAHPGFAARTASSITAVALTCTPTSILTTQTSSCVPTVTGTGSFNNQVTLTASSGKLSATKVSSGTAVVFTPSVAGSALITAVSVQDTTKSASTTVVVGAATLAVSTTSIAFGTVKLNTTVTQPLTLSSTGSAAVTVSSASISGTGFQFSGLTFPVTLSPSQTATLYVGFDPTTAGSFTGKLSLSSNSSTGSTSAVSLTGTGQSVLYQVNLIWSAPLSSSDPVAGYVVYRAPHGTNSYQQLDPVNTATNYVDGTVQNGQSYDYYVVSADASGSVSSPSNTYTAAIPQ